MLSNYLAEVWGISIVIISLALLAKENYLKRIIASMENDANLFLWGFVSLVIGIMMVLSHNIWTGSWQIVITILGWLALLKGLALLFIPEKIKILAIKMGNPQWLPIYLFVLIFIGLVITYFGFTA